MPNRKGSRKSNRKSRRNRKYSGGMAPLNWSNPGPMTQNLAQGVDFAKHHVGQHGGMAPYPGGVVGSMLPGELAASARITSTLQAYNQIKGMQDGGKRQRGGVLVPWGGGRGRGSRKSRKSRKGSRKSRKGSRKSRKSSRKSRKHRLHRGGAGINMAVDSPMMVPESSKMLIPSSMVQQAGLHREWSDAANPRSMMPN